MKYPKVIYNGPPKPDSWCRWAVHRVKRRNNSTNIRFVGDTGSGKSWSGLAVAEKCAKLLGTKITQDNIYFSIRDVIAKVSEEEPKPGTIFFIDEQQVGASSKDHQSKRNKAYTAFMSTVRSNRYIIITTLPFSDMEDKQLRRLFHVELETQGIDLNNNTVITRPRYLEHSRLRDKTYRKRLVIVFKDPETGIVRGKKLSTWAIGKPSKELIDIYEPMKASFKRILYKKLNQELTDYETANEPKQAPGAVMSESMENQLTAFQAAILKHMGNGTKIYRELIPLLQADGFVATPAKICQNVKWMKRKGVVILK
jgi:hypothetical protein